MLFCALMVGILWGGNIGAVFPFVEVVFRGQSLQQYVDREMEQADAKIRQLEEQERGLQLPASERSSVARRERTVRLEQVQLRLQAERSARDVLGAVRPWCSDGCPRRGLPRWSW